ncbi:MAG: hypothetical protein HUU20_16570 [Pirellulales bacterium]|nr:hypothetical protein [Pirellulales bacterium]
MRINLAVAAALVLATIPMDQRGRGQAAAFSERPSGQVVDVLPTPKVCRLRDGRLVLMHPAGSNDRQCCIVAQGDATPAATLLADRLKVKTASTLPDGCVPVNLRIEPAASFASDLNRDSRPEAYRIEIGTAGVDLLAARPEGLLRSAATLLQLLRVEKETVSVPCLEITDWPDFRFRCASDWLINVEANRWAYDWGDGRERFLARVKRKLDLCFDYKINQVWFDGFGWNTGRFPGYAELMRECSRYARRRGIRLTFAGYGGGYGTSYQQSEIYRCGYFGQTFVNRRSYPDGPQYDCRGMEHVPQSRRFGTCLSNQALCQAKLDEMKRFVAAVEPGFLYIHDIDTGSFSESGEAWLLRCEACRKQWPSDDHADPRGQAAALASWFGRICDGLQEVTTDGGYQAKRDLTVIFISPLYTHYVERRPADVWERETEYFVALSRLLGRRPNVQFGLREQFYRPAGGKKIAHLRAALDGVGHGHGIHVIAFGGGDHYQSDDLANISGAMAHFYEGAESVCLSNGGVHEEPVQILNAEFLWSGSARGYREEPPDETAAVERFQRMAKGRCRPAEVFAEGGVFQRICWRLWGDRAGNEMYRAYLVPGESGDGPVSRVWWTVTAAVRRLKAESLPAGFRWEDEHARWLRRLAATQSALKHARKAAALSDHDDVRWFARCLEIGARFAEAVALSVERRIADKPGAVVRLQEVLDDLESQIAASGPPEKTDILGGDPGCWLETLANLREINRLK